MVGGLVLVALVLVTLSFRESDDGPVTSAQNGAAAVLRPFQVAADRIAEPFRDAYGWLDSLFDARSDAERLQQGERDAAPAGRPGQLARAENARLRELLDTATARGSPTASAASPTAVISRPAGAYAQSIVVAAGWNDGVRVDDPVVTQDGLVGTVSRVGSRTARVTLLTDDQSAVSAVDLVDRRGRDRSPGARATGAAPARPRAEGGRRAGRRHRRDRGLAVAAALVALPEGHPDRARHERRPHRHRPLHAGPGEPFADLSSLEAVLVLVPADRGEP